jgi:hypothetical protein
MEEMEGMLTADENGGEVVTEMACGENGGAAELCKVRQGRVSNQQGKTTIELPRGLAYGSKELVEGRISAVR